MNTSQETQSCPQNHSHYLPALIPQLKEFLKKSGISAGAVSRYSTGLKAALQILDELSLPLKAVDSRPFTELFFKTDSQRRRGIYRNLCRFLGYARFPWKQTTGRDELALQDAAALFLNALREKGYKKSTICNYSRSLQSFLSCCGQNGVAAVSGLSRKLLQSFQYDLYVREQERYSPAKKAHILYELKSFFRFLYRSGNALADWGVHLEMPNQEKRISRNIFSTAEIEELFAVMDTTNSWGFMDRTAFDILYGSGLRLGELAALELSDVNMDRGTLFIREGKGGKDRVVPLAASSHRWLAVYLESVRKELLSRYGDPDSPFLFVTGRSTRPVASLMRRLRGALAEYQKLAGFSRLRSPHAFRYSCATHLLENGADIRTVGELLGHSGLDTTGTYTKVSAKNMMEAIGHHPSEAENAPASVTFRGELRR